MSRGILTPWQLKLLDNYWTEKTSPSASGLRWPGLAHAVLGLSGATLTVFGITATPTWNGGSFIVNGQIVTSLMFCSNLTVEDYDLYPQA